jgi:hypothetical protein
MADTVRVVAESVPDRNQRREAEINLALEEEAARHQAAVKNMHRLRALRLAREAKLRVAADAKPTGEKSPGASLAASGRADEIAAALTRTRRSGRKSVVRSGARRRSA